MMRTREKEPRRVPQIVDSGHPHVTQAASPASSDVGGVFSNRSNLVFNKVVVIFEVCPARDGN